MNPNRMNDEPTMIAPDSSTSRQVNWQFLGAGAARAVLDAMPAEMPVLLVTPGAGVDAGPMTAADWEAALVKSLMSRMRPRTTSDVLRGPSDLELHPAARLAFCGGQEIQLTSTEFALLQELLSRDGAVVSVDGLSRAIWGHDTLGAPNYVEAHISRLRRKLRAAGAVRVIETVRGAGYRVRQPGAMRPTVPEPPEPYGSVPPARPEMYGTRDAA